MKETAISSSSSSSRGNADSSRDRRRNAINLPFPTDNRRAIWGGEMYQQSSSSHGGLYRLAVGETPRSNDR